jgi:hypothetical protein
VRAYRHANHPATYKQTWLFSVAMLLPSAVIFYVLTMAGRTLFGVPGPALAFDALFAVYISVVNGLISSYKIHRRRLAARRLADHQG